MGINTRLQYAPLDAFYLDAKNPRLGRHTANPGLSQEEILHLMQNWTLDELAVSFMESGFWAYEALLVVKEELDGHPRLVVVDGNRRLAALTCLRQALNGELVSMRWNTVLENGNVRNELFDKVPYHRFNSRQEIESYLGFHHIAGLKQWFPRQRAQYIARLIDERDIGYEEVARKIGYKTATVRQHYIAYRLLLQMEGSLANFPLEDVDYRFSVMYHLLRMPGAPRYLNIAIAADAQEAKTPVPTTHLPQLKHFARWVFGTPKQPPVFDSSYGEEDFDKILESPEAVRYLETNSNPNVEDAFQLAHGDEPEIISLINGAGGNIAIASSRVQHYKDSPALQRAIERLAVDFKALQARFPNLRSEFLKED